MTAEDMESKWAFAEVKKLSIAAVPTLDDLYKRSLNNRDTKRKLYEKALNAALENLMSWERMARADGFSVTVLTDAHNGEPCPVYLDGKSVSFVQAYGVAVEDKER